jgi:hypothetical protein
MSSTGPTRSKSDLADMVEMLLDKGVVINADIAVSVGETELLGVEIRAAIASFETAAKYGLEFPEGTDMDRVDAAAGRQKSIDRESEDDDTDDGDDDDSDGPSAAEGVDHPAPRPNAMSDESADDTEDDAGD